MLLETPGKPGGLPGLQSAYGLRLQAQRSLLQAVKYEALDRGEVDVVDGCSTDGLIDRYDFVVLEDDLGFFPPYQASPLVGRRFWDTRPDAVRTLSELAGMLDEKAMRTLNRRVEVEEVDGALGILQRIVTPTGLEIAG